MEQKPFAEQCEQCGSSNVSFVARLLSPWDMLAMISRSLGVFSPTFISLSARRNLRQRRQDNQYRCLRCNKTWHVRRGRTATLRTFRKERIDDATSA
jgi:hypothetical protein